MKKVAIIAASLLVFWSCDSTPGGNKDVLPESHEASDHHGGGHGDTHGADSHDNEHKDDSHAADSHKEDGHDEDFVSDFSDFVKIEFTAFKTPDKVGVKGQFADVKVTAHSRGESVANQMKLAEAVIKTSSIKTGDDARDTTLKNEFFSKLTGETITAKILDIHDDKAEIEIIMNGKTATKTFDFHLSDDNHNKAVIKGSIDMLSDFSANTAYESIAKACEVLHSGKTWTDVDLEVTIEL